MNSKTKPVKYGLIITSVLSLVMLYTSCSKDETMTNPESQKNIELSDQIVSQDPATQAPYGPTQSVGYYLKLDGDTGTCPYGPGFCPDYSSPLTTGHYVSGTDANGSITLNSNSTITLIITQIRPGWFNEGGYLDGTFSIPELTLDENISNSFGASAITLMEGVYDMVTDGSTGHYTIVVDVVVQ